MSKMVMSAISEDVKWREDREQIVRYADERLAMEHPKVREEIERLRYENRKLHERYFDEARLFEELAMLVSVPFWKIGQYKALIKAHGRLAKPNQ